VRTPDDVYEYAHERGLCGYELLKEGMEGVDLVVCNYHHLLNPGIREQFFRWLGRDPEDVVAVFDEGPQRRGRGPGTRPADGHRDDPRGAPSTNSPTPRTPAPRPPTT